MVFALMESLFPVVFLLTIGLFIAIVVKGLMERSENNRSPRLTVNARVVAKRQSVSHMQQPNAGDITGAHGYSDVSSTNYYATFQVESGDSMELRLNGTDYGELAEGDVGRLSFQGTRYLGFERLYEE